MAVRGTVDAGAGGALVTSVSGTANQVTATPTTGAVVVSTPSDFRLPGTINLLTLTQPATAATLTIANNKTLSVSNTLTFTGTDASSVAFGAGGTVLYNSGALGKPSSGDLSTTNAVTILGQSAIPFIMVGSGTMIANGVGALTTALGTTYASSYCYFAVNAIASGVPAGWYYTVFSSTTAFVVYNNTYTSGTPTIPGSPTAFSTVSPVTYTGSSAAINAYQLTIPGNTLGANGAIRVLAATMVTGTTANKTIALLYGGSVFTQFIVAVAANILNSFIGGVRNRGVVNSQVSLSSVGVATGTGASTTAATYSSIDTTASQTLAIQYTNATPASNNMVLEQVTVELLPGVA